MQWRTFFGNLRTINFLGGFVVLCPISEHNADCFLLCFVLFWLHVLGRCGAAQRVSMQTPTVRVQTSGLHVWHVGLNLGHSCSRARIDTHTHWTQTQTNTHAYTHRQRHFLPLQRYTHFPFGPEAKRKTGIALWLARLSLQLQCAV